MKLIMTPTSPFARKVRIVLAEKRIECEQVIDSPWEANTRVPDYNPLGMVPVLVLDFLKQYMSNKYVFLALLNVVLLIGGHCRPVVHL